MAHEVEYRMDGYGRLEPLEYDVAVLVDAITRRLEAGRRLPPVTHHEIAPPSSECVRAAKFYSIEYRHETRTLSWSRNDDEHQADAGLHGCYHLRCSRADLRDDDIWHIYTRLKQLEKLKC